MAVALIDPVAQTFFVDAATYPKGMFVHSVDLMFKKKDTITFQPFTVQLRPTVNGYPHSSLIHSSAALGQVSLNSEKIKTVSGIGSNVPVFTNNNHFTRFEFPAPIFLLPGEHAIVLFTNSDDYEVFISEIGGTRLDGSDRRVVKQPYAGSFFKSQNGSTYTPFQDLDLMFRLNACKFTLGTTSLILENSPVSANAEYDFIKLSTQELTFKGTSTDYFFKATNNTSFVLDSTFNNIIVNDDFYLEDRQVVSATSNGSLIIKADLGTTDNTVSSMIDITRVNAIGIKYIINNCDLSDDNFTIIDPGAGYTSNGTVTIVGGTGTGATAVAVANVTSGQVETIVVTNGGLGFTENVTATITGGGASANATVVVASETNAKGGTAFARYITRKVNLADGFDANMIRVYLTAYQPNESTIEVYYKVVADEDPTLFENRPYVRMLNVQQGDEDLLNSKKSEVETDFFEYLFIPKTATTSYVGLENSVVYPIFRTFAIKIVMRTSNPAYVPIIRDLRAIALAP